MGLMNKYNQMKLQNPWRNLFLRHFSFCLSNKETKSIMNWSASTECSLGVCSRDHVQRAQIKLFLFSFLKKVVVIQKNHKPIMKFDVDRHKFKLLLFSSGWNENDDCYFSRADRTFSIVASISRFFNAVNGLAMFNSSTSGASDPSILITKQPL